MTSSLAMMMAYHSNPVKGKPVIPESTTNIFVILSVIVFVIMVTIYAYAKMLGPKKFKKIAKVVAPLVLMAIVFVLIVLVSNKNEPSLSSSSNDDFSYDTYRSRRRRTQTRNRSAETSQITFHWHKDNLRSIITKISTIKNANISFHIANGGKNATGNGATRQVLDRLFTELQTAHMVKVNHWVYEVDDNDDFWMNQTNIEAVALLIAISTKFTYVFNFHFSPRFLECLAHSAMTPTECTEFVRHFDIDVYNSCQPLSFEKFSQLELGYVTKTEYYRNLLYHCTTDSALKIHRAITIAIEPYTKFPTTVTKIDNQLSGPYKLVARDVLEICTIDDERYATTWRRFINSLSENELRQMLMVFGCTTSTMVEYTISIEFDMEQDIKIETCFYRAKLSDRLFKNMGTMMALKQYFGSNDQFMEDQNIE